jgi:very-short-patch-repair endonuclease
MDVKWRHARELRSGMTDAERALWRHLRARQLQGRKFRRQYPIAGFIADFACVEVGLVIELDGGQHAEQLDYDRMRDNRLNEAGYRVLRFWNHEVLGNMEGVIDSINAAMLQPHPNPPLQGRGGGENP